jgi:hypothetical protein
MLLIFQRISFIWFKFEEPICLYWDRIKSKLEEQILAALFAAFLNG